MRVNVDSAALTDPRIKKLGLKIGCDWREALGRILSVWMLAYDRKTARIDREDVDIASEKIGFADAMVSVGLAISDGGDIVHIRGVEDRIVFLKKQQFNALKGGRPRNPLENPKEPNGFRVANPNQKSGKPYSLSLSLSQDQDLSLAQDPRERERARGRKVATKVALPADWVPGSDLVLLASELGVDAKAAADSMRDWALAENSRKADWAATFRNWLRRDAKSVKKLASKPDSRYGRFSPEPNAIYPDGEIAL